MKDTKGTTQQFAVAVNGKIHKLPAVKENKTIWLQASGFQRILKESEISGDFDASTGILTIDSPSAAAITELPSPSKPVLVLVLNGKIHKTERLDKDNTTYLSLKTAERIFVSLGFAVDSDQDTGVLAATKAGGTAPAATASNNTGSSAGNSSQTGSSTQNPPVASDSGQSAVGSKEKVAPFMAAMKKIFDENKVSKEEQSKFDSAIENSDKGVTISPDDLAKVKSKYLAIRDQIKTLTPPDKETEEIHTLAVDVFEKMAKVTEKASALLNLGAGLDNPRIVEEIQELNRQIAVEGFEFNEKVKAIRKKYELGPP